MAERPKSQAPRRRLPADEARARILEAAERKLAAVGPEGLRLTDLGAELGISHAAILHHFGSREELVLAVIARAFGRVNARLTEALESRDRSLGALLDMIAEFYGGEGNARLIGWLALSGRAPKPRAQGAGAARPLQRLIELAHQQRAKVRPDADYEDTRFRSQLTALALLGEAIFGDMIRAASGDAGGAEASRDFRRRLAALLLEKG